MHNHIQIPIELKAALKFSIDNSILSIFGEFNCNSSLKASKL